MTTAPTGPAAERPPLPVDPARAARHADRAARPVLWPLLIGAWKRKEQP